MIQPACRDQKLLGNSHPMILIGILRLGVYTNPDYVDGFLVSLYLCFVHFILLGVSLQPAIHTCGTRIDPNYFGKTWVPNTPKIDNLTIVGEPFIGNLMINSKG